MDKRNIAIDDTKFIFETNFAGDPSRDKFGDTRRKCNIKIPDPEQAKDLIKMGIKVKQTRPGAKDDPETFQPEYFVTALLKYRNKFGECLKYPPKVFLVSGDADPVPLDEDSVNQLDNMWVKNVNVVLNTYAYNEAGDVSLCVRTMYVEQRLDDDPYAARYRRRAHVQEPDMDGDDLPY